MSQVRRPRAVELRFVVSAERAAEILSWARAELEADPHGRGPHRDAYRVTSLYFDTPRFDVVHRRGSYGRAKYRIRRYGAEDTVFLERKLRTNDMLVKRRTQVPLEPWDEGLDEDQEGAWFRRRIAARQLKAMCVIAYDRVARQTTSGGSVARLTVDSNVRAGRTDEDSYPFPPADQPLLPGQSIVELKYQGTAPAAFKALAERFLLVPATVSKYRAAATALEIVGATT